MNIIEINKTEFNITLIRKLCRILNKSEFVIIKIYSYLIFPCSYFYLYNVDK